MAKKKPAAGKKLVKLCHVSNVKGANGNPGDELEVDAQLADRWIENGGAVDLNDEDTDDDEAEPTK